jgi:hypothetical protein
MLAFRLLPIRGRQLKQVIKALVLMLLPLSAWSQVKVNALPSGSTPSSGDYTICDQSGTTNKCTMAQVATFVGGNLPAQAAGTVLGNCTTATGVPTACTGYPVTEVPLTAAGTMALNGTTDDSAAFNTFEASLPANTIMVVPAGAIIGTTTTLNLSVVGHVLKFESGAKISALNGLTSTYLLNMSANNTGTINAEINGNVTNQTNLVGAWEITGSPTGITMSGLTYVHDLNWYGGYAYDAAQVTVENYYGYNIKYPCFFADNNANTAQAQIYIKKIFCNRSMVAASGNTWPSVQILGTSTYPTILQQNNTTLFNVINPAASGSEGEEVRYSNGSIDNFESNDGGICLSLGFGSDDINIANVICKGAKYSGFEVSGTVTGNGGHVNVSNLHIDGTNSSAIATTSRCLILDGTVPNAIVNISNFRINGCTDDILYVSNYASIQQWSDIYLVNGDEDGTSLNGGSYGQDNCNFLSGGTTAAGAQRVHFDNVWCHGGASATRLLKTQNANYVYGNIGADNINGTLVDIEAEGSGFSSDHINLFVSVGANNPSTNHVTTSAVSSGTFGSNIQIFGNGLVGNVTGYTINYLDLAAGLISAYGTTSPNGSLNGALGSTALLTSGAQYKNTNGTTGWTLVSNVNGSVPYGLTNTQDVQTFTSSGTWTAVSSAYKSVCIDIGGGGGGGGSGAQVASLTNTSGGAGGGGGIYKHQCYTASQITSPQTVTIGSGGAGGAATSGTGSGNPGVFGNSTTFGSLAYAPGGGGGAAGAAGTASGGGGGGGLGTGTTGTTSGGAGGGFGAGAGGTNGAGISAGGAGGGGEGNLGTGVAGSTAGDSYSGGPGGASGGGLSAASAFNGGNGGVTGTVLSNSRAIGGAATGANGNNGANVPGIGCGQSGGGGGSNASGTGGNAGTSGLCAGGSGGGASVGAASGAGATGGGGFVVVTTYF